MKINILIFILLLLLSCKRTKNINNTPLNINKTIEKTSFYEDLEGNPVLLSDYKNKKIVLNFWATWCQPCVNEMPSLLKAAAILKKNNYVFLLASNESAETIKAFKNTHNFNFNFIKFTGNLSSLKIYALPKTFIYNTKGKKISEISGAQTWNSPTVINRLKNIK